MAGPVLVPVLVLDVPVLLPVLLQVVLVAVVLRVLVVVGMVLLQLLPLVVSVVSPGAAGVTAPALPVQLLGLDTQLHVPQQLLRHGQDGRLGGRPAAQQGHPPNCSPSICWVRHSKTTVEQEEQGTSRHHTRHPASQPL